MSSMVQGDAYSLAVTVKNNGQAVEIDDIEKIEMTLLICRSITQARSHTRTGNSISRWRRKKHSACRRSARCRFA